MIKLFIKNLNALVILIEYGLPSVGGDVIPALMPDASLTAIVIYVSPEAVKNVQRTQAKQKIIHLSEHTE